MDSETDSVRPSPEMEQVIEQLRAMVSIDPASERANDYAMWWLETQCMPHPPTYPSSSG